MSFFKKSITTLAATTILASCGAESSSSLLEDPSTVAVTIKSVETKEDRGGQTCLAVFNSPEGFPDEEGASIFEKCYPVADVIAGVDVSLPAAGEYAFSIFHDQNEDGTLNTSGPFGIPSEGFGFSNNPGLKIGAPDYEETAVNVEDGTTVEIKFIYIR